MTGAVAHSHERQPRVVLHYENFGPYHIARAKAAVPRFRDAGIELIPLQVLTQSSTYTWGEGSEEFPLIHAGGVRARNGVPSWSSVIRLFRVLDRLRPDAILVNGWSARDAVAMHLWCS